MKKIGDVCHIIGGGTPSKKKPEYYNGEIPWATVRDMNVDLLTTTDHTITRLGLEESSSNLVPAGNLIIASRVGLGKACILGQDTAINQDLKGLKPKSDHINVQYLYFWYQSVGSQVEADGTGMTVKGVTVKYLQNLQIPLPPLPEQRRIVAKLDAAFAEIARARVLLEENLAAAGEVFESRLGAVFGEINLVSELQPIGKLSFTKSGGTPSRSKADYWDKNDHPWYSSGELNDVFTKDPKEYISDAGLNSSNARLFPAGSLLIGIYDTAALKMSIADRPATFNQAIVGVEPNEKIDMRFLMLAIEAQKNELLKLRRGVRQKNLSLAKIKAIIVPVPKPNVQDEIVKKVDAFYQEVQTLRHHYHTQLAALSELKQSLLARAFNSAAAFGGSGAL